MYYTSLCKGKGRCLFILYLRFKNRFKTDLQYYSRPPTQPLNIAILPAGRYVGTNIFVVFINLRTSGWWRFTKLASCLKTFEEQMLMTTFVRFCWYVLRGVRNSMLPPQQTGAVVVDAVNTKRSQEFTFGSASWPIAAGISLDCFLIIVSKMGQHDICEYSWRHPFYEHGTRLRCPS